jgi:hypothetical protein
MKLIIVFDLPEADSRLWDPWEIADNLLSHGRDMETFRADAPVFTDYAHRTQTPELVDARFVSAEWEV